MKTKKSVCPMTGLNKPRRYAVSAKAWASLSDAAKLAMKNPRKGTLRGYVWMRRAMAEG